MKKYAMAFCAAVMSMLIFGVTVYASGYVTLQIDNPNMNVNGNIKAVGTAPVIRNGATFVPLRSVIEALGGTVAWDSGERKISICMPSKPAIVIITLYENGTYEAYGMTDAENESAERKAAKFLSELEEYLSANENTGIDNAVQEFGGRFWLPGSDSSYTNPTIELIDGDTKINLWVDKKTASVNGKDKALNVAPVVINGSTMIPLRFVTENLGFEVKWVDSGRYIIIADEKITPQLETSIKYPPTPVNEQPKSVPFKEVPNPKQPSNSDDTYSFANAQLEQINSAADMMYNAGIYQIRMYQDAGIPVPYSALSTLNQAYTTYEQVISLAGQLGVSSSDPAVVHARNRIAEIRRIRGY